MNFHSKITITFLLLISWSNAVFCFAEENKKTSKDTISALVISPTNPMFTQLSNLNGNQIIDIIDSLLDLDDVPIGLIKEIAGYAETKLIEKDFFITLTNYYDDSEIPSNTMYQKWDNKAIFSYGEEICKNDSSLLLTLTDKKHFCDYAAPLKNPLVTSNFGWRKGRAHTGIDLDLQVWDPVAAAFDGMVRVAYYHPAYGRVVVIRHYNGLETLYAHLHRFKVKSGDIVEAGQIIGLGGSSGHSTGSHLHFEVRFKGKPLNPKHLISFKENKLVSDSILMVKQKWNYSAVPLGVEYHTIKSGDFMYKIANRYGISVNELCELNGMRRNSILRIGKKIRIK